MLKKFLIGFLSAAALAAATPAAAATLIVDGGDELTVNVSGSLYDVSLLDGTCSELFNGCDGQADFMSTSMSTAEAAAVALLAEVFLGDFDLTSALTFGCEDTDPPRHVRQPLHELSATPHGDADCTEAE